MDIKATLQDYVDYLVPHLDCYEQTLYIYLFRHSCLTGTSEVTVGFKSARRKMGFGIGTKGHGMSEGTCYEKLQSLQKKGCIKILDSTTTGTRIHIMLPAEIPDIVPLTAKTSELDIEEMDFFSVPKNRDAILKREGHKCFYCLRLLNTSNYVIEHVSPRETGGNGYRNVVAGCQVCNNRKNDLPVDDFLRVLYREGLLSADELTNRTKALERLRAGELKPAL
jgi:hypothetical protein